MKTLRSMNSEISALMWMSVGACVGVAACILLDPARGAARRARIRDKAFSISKDAAEATRKKADDVKWRTKGALHEAKARLQEKSVPDHILAERVRAQLGRPVSHPRSIEVSANDGCITLSGPILSHEVDGLLSRVKSVRGVKQIENELDVHPSPTNIPSLQGEGARQSRG